MRIINIFVLLLAWLTLPLTVCAQAFPSAQPTMTIILPNGEESEETDYEGSAPFVGRFEAHPENVGSYTPYYEWRFTRQGEVSPYLTRFEENTELSFTESGAFEILLRISFVQGTDTIDFESDQPFVVNVPESKLEVPNAFTPNGDGINDIFKVKEGHQSIVAFEATVFNRGGRKLYEWTDIDSGWDGRSGGSAVPDGAYYVVVKAKGADGREYDIKKTINILRGFTESATKN